MEGIPPIYFNLYCMHILINVQAFCAVLKKKKKPYHNWKCGVTYYLPENI